MILLPLKTIVSGIKSQDAVEHVSPILQRIFESPLKSQLREKSSSKSRSEAIFEVYYLILRLSDNIAIPLYDKKILSQARKLCKRDLVHFPVCPRPYDISNKLVELRIAVQRSRWIELQSDKRS